LAKKHVFGSVGKLAGMGCQTLACALGIMVFFVDVERLNHHSSILNWEILKEQKIIKRRKYVTHVQFKKSLIVKMDGKKRISVITWN